MKDLSVYQGCIDSCPRNFLGLTILKQGTKHTDRSITACDYLQAGQIDIMPLMKHCHRIFSLLFGTFYSLGTFSVVAYCTSFPREHHFSLAVSNGAIVF